MPDAALLSLATKMATSAAVVVMTCKAIECSGPLVGALIATLPVSAGPNYAFLAAEHGPAFLAESTLAGLAANAATIVFILVYGLLARHRGILVSLGAAYAVWLAAACAVVNLTWSHAAAIAINVAAFAVAMPLARPLRAEASLARAESRPADLPARALGVMALVGAVVVAGRIFGAAAAGVTAVVPITLTSVAVLLHRRLGGRAAAAALAHTLPGMVGFTVALAILSLTALPLGSAAALGLGLAICVLWNLALAASSRPARRRAAKS